MGRQKYNVWVPEEPRLICFCSDMSLSEEQMFWTRLLDFSVFLVKQYTSLIDRGTISCSNVAKIFHAYWSSCPEVFCKKGAQAWRWRLNKIISTTQSISFAIFLSSFQCSDIFLSSSYQKLKFTWKSEVFPLWWLCQI